VQKAAPPLLKLTFERVDLLIEQQVDVGLSDGLHIGVAGETIIQRTDEWERIMMMSSRKRRRRSRSRRSRSRRSRRRKMNSRVFLRAIGGKLPARMLEVWGWEGGQREGTCTCAAVARLECPWPAAASVTVCLVAADLWFK
jgi:hypothetical protein